MRRRRYQEVIAPVPPDLKMRAKEAPCLFVTYDVETGRLVQVAAAAEFSDQPADLRITALLHLIQQLRVRVDEALVEMDDLEAK